MPRSVKRRYLLGFLCAAAMLVLVGIGTIVAAVRSSGDDRLVAHTYAVLGTIGEIQAILYDGIAAQRNYLLTEDEGYRRQYESARPRLAVVAARLGDLVRDNPAQLGRSHALQTALSERLDASDESLRVFERSGLEAARTKIRRNSLLGLTRHVQSIADEMTAAERALLSQRIGTSRRSTRLILGMGVLGGPLGLAILGWIYVLLSREVRERELAMRTSDEAKHRLAEGVRDLENATRDLQALNHCSNLLQSSRNVPEALGVARRALSALLPDAAGSIYLIGESRSHAEAEAAWGEPTAASDAVIDPDACWALRRGQPYVAADLAAGLPCDHVHASALPSDSGQAALASACLPLASHGTTLGLLYLCGDAERLLAKLPSASTAAEQLSLALGNLRLQQTLRHQSIRDPLTGLFNRRYLEESLSRELARCERRGLPLALLMLDLDHFKALNDRHGHDAGDAALTAFGKLLQASCREEDIACRYGGEEFVLVLPEVGLEVALQRAERLRDAAAALSVRHLQREVGPVTVSIGIAAAPAHATSQILLKRLADEALYRAKDAGRNRVELASAGD